MVSLQCCKAFACGIMVVGCCYVVARVLLGISL